MPLWPERGTGAGRTCRRRYPCARTAMACTASCTRCVCTPSCPHGVSTRPVFLPCGASGVGDGGAVGSVDALVRGRSIVATSSVLGVRRNHAALQG
jgi:hypothetical protein